MIKNQKIQRLSSCVFLKVTTISSFPGKKNATSLQARKSDSNNSLFYMNVCLCHFLKRCLLIAQNQKKNQMEMRKIHLVKIWLARGYLATLNCSYVFSSYQRNDDMSNSSFGSSRNRFLLRIRDSNAEFIIRWNHSKKDHALQQSPKNIHQSFIIQCSGRSASIYSSSRSNIVQLCS